jgi:DNA-directed RNA polymerase subunit RPC12/RpoP
MIILCCSYCSKKLPVKDDLAGQQTQCPDCGQGVLVPAAIAVPSPQQKRPPKPEPTRAE